MSLIVSFPTSASRCTLAVRLKVQPRMREMDFCSTWTKQQIILYSLYKDPAANSIKFHINVDSVILYGSEVLELEKTEQQLVKS